MQNDVKREKTYRGMGSHNFADRSATNNFILIKYSIMVSAFDIEYMYSFMKYLGYKHDF